jgi:hypothetical protein
MLESELPGCCSSHHVEGGSQPPFAPPRPPPPGAQDVTGVPILGLVARVEDLLPHGRSAVVRRLSRRAPCRAWNDAS